MAKKDIEKEITKIKSTKKEIQKEIENIKANETENKNGENLQTKVEKSKPLVIANSNEKKYETKPSDYTKPEENLIESEEFKPDYEKQTDNENEEYLEENKNSEKQPELPTEGKENPNKQPEIGSDEERIEKYLESIGQLNPKYGGVETPERKKRKELLKREMGYKKE